MQRKNGMAKSLKGLHTKVNDQINKFMTRMTQNNNIKYF